MSKNFKILILLVCIILSIAGCSKNNPTVITVEGTSDYQSEMKLVIQGEEYGEKVLMIPIHIYYNKDKSAYVINTNSSHTVTIPEGKKFEFNLQGTSEEFAIDNVGNIELKWTCTDQEGKTSNGKNIRINFKVIKTDNDSIEASYEINGVKAKEPLSFKFKAK